MDIGAFSEDSFDAKDWINKTFESAEAQENKDAFVSSLVMKLQLYVQQVNAALEDTSQQVLSSLPRIIRDTQALQLEAQTLKDKMAAVHCEIDEVQSESGQCMASLERLDTLKTQLQSAKQSLLEADNWTTLVMDIEELFEKSDVVAVAERLQAMNISLQAMEKHVDAADKASQLEGLRNRLEALASPQLVQAFTTRSIEQAKQFVTIFSSMDRLPQLIAYYKTCQKAGLNQKWRECVENTVGVGFLQEFYDQLLQHSKEQIKWCASVLPPGLSLEVVSSTIVELFPVLEPTQGVALQAVLKLHPDKLTILADSVQQSKKFASSINTLISNQSHEELKPGVRLSLSQCIFSYLIPFVSQYPSLESTQLSITLSSLPGAQVDPADTVQNLSLSNSKVIQGAFGALSRCESITQGCAYPGLARVVEAYLISYCDQYRLAIRQLERCRTIEQDWNTFQMCISLMQALGDTYTQVQNLDAQLSKQAIEKNKTLSCDNPFQQYKLLLLNKVDNKTFENFIKNIEQADVNCKLFESLYGKIQSLSSDLHKVMFNNVFAPLVVQIEAVHSAPAWTGNDQVVLAADLPEFSYSPQEYITQIGQYLMTLPQHLEPFLLQPHANLIAALKLCDPEYDSNMAADVLLSLVFKSTCSAYADALLQICKLDTNACKQLAVDIEYLGSVLEELGLSSVQGDLAQWPTLLRCPPDMYHQQTGTPRLVTAIRQMRGITSTAA